MTPKEIAEQLTKLADDVKKLSKEDIASLHWAAVYFTEAVPGDIYDEA